MLTQENIIYVDFPTCKETGKPLTFHFLQDERINCTFPLVDETFHLFQLYIHEDAPFSCRVANGSYAADTSEPSYINMPLNVQGDISKSHLDIDSTLNILFFTRPTDPLNANSVAPMSAIGFSTAYSMPKRYIIGDYITFEIDVRWYSGTTLPPFSMFRFSTSTVAVLCAAAAVGAVVVTFGLLYGLVFPKKLKAAHLGGGEYSKLD
jgi:hypothetical protein